MGKKKKHQNRNTKEKIQDAATKLIGERGYSNITLEEIAKEAGTGKSTIFYYFKSKEEILSRIMEQSVLEVHRGLQEIVESDLAPEEKLKRALNNHFHYLVKYIDNVTIFLREFRYLSPQKKRIYIQGRKSYESLFEKIIRDLQEKQRFSGLNPKVVIFGVLGMCNWLIVWYKEGRPGYLGPKAIANIFYRMLMEGQDPKEGLSLFGKRRKAVYL